MGGGSGSSHASSMARNCGEEDLGLFFLVAHRCIVDEMMGVSFSFCSCWQEIIETEGGFINGLG